MFRASTPQPATDLGMQKLTYGRVFSEAAVPCPRDPLPTCVQIRPALWPCVERRAEREPTCHSPLPCRTAGTLHANTPPPPLDLHGVTEETQGKRRLENKAEKESSWEAGERPSPRLHTPREPDTNKRTRSADRRTYRQMERWGRTETKRERERERGQQDLGDIRTLHLMPTNTRKRTRVKPPLSCRTKRKQTLSGGLPRRLSFAVEVSFDAPSGFLVALSQTLLHVYKIETLRHKIDVRPTRMS